MRFDCRSNIEIDCAHVCAVIPANTRSRGGTINSIVITRLLLVIGPKGFRMCFVMAKANNTEMADITYDMRMSLNRASWNEFFLIIIGFRNRMSSTIVPMKRCKRNPMICIVRKVVICCVDSLLQYVIFSFMQPLVHGEQHLSKDSSQIIVLEY